MENGASRLLEGVRVLDLTRVLAGPYATMLLADLGAEVIKIEPPEGDDTRRIGPPFVGGESAYFLAVNRGKRSAVLDLKSDEGRSAFARLAAKADVVVDNFRPGVMDRLGLSPAALHALNPRLVLCSISSFGDEGPMRDLPAFDLVTQAWSGMMSVTGEPGRAPVRLGVPLGDLSGGIHAALAVSAALYRREKTGKGGRIELSLLDCLVSMLTYLAQYHWADGRVPGPQGASHEASVPYGVFRTSDGWLALAVFTDRFWPRFCEAVGRPAWGGDPRFSTGPGRHARRAELELELSRLFATEPTEAWRARLAEAGIPAAPVLSLDKTLALEQLVLRGMVASYDHPRAGTVKTLASPIARAPVRPAPTLGQHTDEILRSI